jgi:hypothetical protein
MLDAPMELRRYRTVGGRVPFSDWLMGLEASTFGRVLISGRRANSPRIIGDEDESATAVCFP